MVPFVRILLFMHTLPLFGGVCKVYVSTEIKEIPLITLDRCEIGGALYATGPYLTGDFVVDLAKLMSNSSQVDDALATLSLPRYATFDLEPVRIGDKEFHGLLKFNNVAQRIGGKVMSSSFKHLDTYFSVDLTSFNFPGGDKYDLINMRIDVTARVGDERFKKNHKRVPK